MQEKDKRSTKQCKYGFYREETALVPGISRPKEKISITFNAALNSNTLSLIPSSGFSNHKTIRSSPVQVLSNWDLRKPQLLLLSSTANLRQVYEHE